jgi:hypothetical protein
VKTLRGLIAAVLLVATAMAAPAAAHVAEVTTTIPLADVHDADSLRRSIGEAVDRARTQTIAFEPSVVAVTGVRIVGQHVLVGLLFADEDGKAMLESLHGSEEGDRRDEGGDGEGAPAVGELRI